MHAESMAEKIQEAMEAARMRHVCGVAVVFGALAMRSERCAARLAEWHRFEWFAQGRPLCSSVGRKVKHSRGVRQRVELVVVMMDSIGPCVARRRGDVLLLLFGARQGRRGRQLVKIARGGSSCQDGACSVWGEELIRATTCGKPRFAVENKWRSMVSW